jgi:serine/threonine protein kinase
LKTFLKIKIISENILMIINIIMGKQKIFDMMYNLLHMILKHLKRNFRKSLKFVNNLDELQEILNHLDKTKATRKAGHGTPRYMSPEQLDGKLSFKCDIWALGCVLLEFSTGVKPFENVASEVAMCLKIFQGSSPLDYALENNNAESELIIENDDFKELLKLCFINDYKQRPSAEELFENSFFSGYTTYYY